MIISGIGDGFKLRRDIQALRDVSKLPGDMQYMASNSEQARVPGPTSTDIAVLFWDGERPYWVSLTGTATQEYANQADMELTLATGVSVTPEVMQFHPGVAKAWAYFTVAGLVRGYNVTSVDRTASGRFGVRFTTNFSSTDYAFFCNAEQEFAGTVVYAGLNATASGGQLASSFDMLVLNSGGAPADPRVMTAMFFGDQ